MESVHNQKLSTLLRASLAGEIALFATFLSDEEEDVEEMSSEASTLDARGRKIYEVFKIMNPPDDADLELCTDLHFNSDDADLSLSPGAVIDREVDHAVFGKTTMRLVKLTSEDADFLLGVLPDELLEQIAVYQDMSS